jgi:hypothetical protein
MAEAEAAQQALLTSGTLAKRAQDSPTLNALLVTYCQVQGLYHKAMLPHVRSHQQLSGTAAGLAYAMLCDVLAQPLAKQAGDQITDAELQQLVEQVQRLPSLQAQHPVALLAIEVAAVLGNWPDELSTVDVCVMPDVISLLGGDQVTLPEAAASTAGGLSGLLQSAVSKAGQLMALNPKPFLHYMELTRVKPRRLCVKLASHLAALLSVVQQPCSSCNSHH